MGMLPANIDKRLKSSIVLATIVGAALPMAGFFGGYLAVILTLVLSEFVRMLDVELVKKAFVIFSAVVMYFGGGALAGFLSLAFLAKQIESERRRALHTRVAAASWILLCAVLPWMVAHLTWWQERDFVVYLRNIAVFFFYGGAMALCLGFYVRARSINTKPHSIHLGFAGGLVFSFLSPLLGIYGQGLWKIILVSSAVSAVWGGCVTYFLLRPRETASALPSTGSAP